MTRNAQHIIDDMRNIVKPRIAKMLLEANFEGCGKEDKAEFETEFEMILTLAEKTLEQELILDKIRAEIMHLDYDLYSVDYDYNDMTQIEEVHTICREEVLQVIDKYKTVNDIPAQNAVSQNIIEHAKRIFPKSVSYRGQLTDKQFCEIEKQCDIDFYTLISQDIKYTIRYKAESEDKK